jgi:hypothetical protein
MGADPGEGRGLSQSDKLCLAITHCVDTPPAAGLEQWHHQTGATRPITGQQPTAAMLDFNLTKKMPDRPACERFRCRT